MCHRCERSLTRLEGGATLIGEDYYCDECIREIEGDVDWSQCVFSSAFPERKVRGRKFVPARWKRRQRP